MRHVQSCLFESERRISLNGQPSVLEEMKKIEAIIIPFKVDAVRAELGRCGVNASLILTDVRHAENRKRSRSPHTETLDSLTDRLKVELIVGDRQVQRAVEAITQYGQVALLRVNESLQIVPALSNTQGNLRPTAP
jgi:nitrogen regulatory protein PII